MLSSRSRDGDKDAVANDLFEKHTPKYPLPVEILKMKKDETVCQFCGVSYLIHNEIKKLEDRVKELERELKDYDTLKLREKQFKQINDEMGLKIRDLDEKLSTRIQMISSLNTDIESKDLEISRLKRLCQEHDSNVNLLTVTNESLKKKILQYESVVKATMLNIANQKSELKNLELAARNQNKMMIHTVAEVQSKMDAFSNRKTRESNAKDEEIHELKSQISSINKKYKEQQEQVAYLNNQIESLQTIRNELSQQIAIMSEESTKTMKINQACIDLEREKTKLAQQNAELKFEIESIRSKHSNAANDQNELKSRINLLQEKLNSQKNSYEKELGARADELKKTRQDFESMKKRYDEREKFEKDLLSNHQSNLTEVGKLKGEIQRFNDLITDMQNERKAITLAHQCQITQLKESFKEKLKMSEDLPDKFASELEREREKHQKQMQQLESSLKENFKMDFEIQQQKYNEMYIKYQQISKEFEGNSRNRINDLEAEKQRLISELKFLHEEKLTNEKKFRQDIENLRNVAKELHERLEKYSEDGGDGDIRKLKLKEELIEKNSRINELESQIKALESQYHSSKEEVRILQETVHKECLEREELHEKLEECRDELLMLKKNAYINQQVLPIRSVTGSNPNLNQSPTSKLIDVNNNPTSIKSQNSYPRNLNELNGQMSNRFASPNGNNLNSGKGGNVSRRNSVVNYQNSRSPSEKSTAESTSKVIEPLARNRTQHNIQSSITAANKGVSLLATTNQATEPIQLFKKINELSNKSSLKASNGNTSNVNTSMADSKRRISLLLARKT